MYYSYRTIGKFFKFWRKLYDYDRYNFIENNFPPFKNIAYYRSKYDYLSLFILSS